MNDPRAFDCQMHYDHWYYEEGGKWLEERIAELNLENKAMSTTNGLKTELLANLEYEWETMNDPRAFDCQMHYDHWYYEEGGKWLEERIAELRKCLK